MVSIEAFTAMALSFPEAVEEPHFEKSSFRVSKKIFATLNETENRATIKLSAIDQDVFCCRKDLMFPVPNQWGKQGWTHINLLTIPEEMCLDALTTSYCEVAPKKLVSTIKSK
ncbi:MmcQ/YjbR family DNA-binding protein [Flavobacterium sp.]|uniref:MmcQ/YjbR family DNA-binding protein n=1 Tax=Flavobacterium sp. TaxID=239 RepID=UPI00286B02A0|nr:MmcQ/YjbR family DNA-binding protein [Flavobacterium sp.]